MCHVVQHPFFGKIVPTKTLVQALPGNPFQLLGNIRIKGENPAEHKHRNCRVTEIALVLGAIVVGLHMAVIRTDNNMVLTRTVG